MEGVSRKHGHRKHRRRKRRATSAAQALAAVAAALNQAGRCGVPVRIRHGVLWSDFGVILPPGKKEPWLARPFLPGSAPQPDDLDG